MVEKCFFEVEVPLYGRKHNGAEQNQQFFGTNKGRESLQTKLRSRDCWWEDDVEVC